MSNDSEREPDEIGVCKQHYVWFSGPEPCGICTLRESLRAAERALEHIVGTLDVLPCDSDEWGNRELTELDKLQDLAEAALAEIRRARKIK